RNEQRKTFADGGPVEIDHVIGKTLPHLLHEAFVIREFALQVPQPLAGLIPRRIEITLVRDVADAGEHRIALMLGEHPDLRLAARPCLRCCEMAEVKTRNPVLALWLGALALIGAAHCATALRTDIQ